MEHYPLVFPRLTTDLIRAAEQTGSLHSVLEELAVHYDRELAARRKIKQALAYPLTIVALSVLVVILLVSYVIPQFVRLFDEFDAALPLTTRMLIGMTNFFSSSYLYIIGVVIVVGFGGYYLFNRTVAGKRLWHRVLLRIPVVGKVVQASLTERYARTLATLLEAGVPIARAFEVVGPSMNNLLFEERLMTVREEVVAGESLSWALGSTGLFGSMVIQMVRTGEQTGTLDAQLRYLADFYRDELDYRVDRATTYLEPAVLIFVGLGVGFVAVAMISTMYGIFGSVE
jgi:type IV pilus assembly protein PilC